MGVIYKLKPEIKDFILQQKQAYPEISCRKLSQLINEKLQIKVSKSHVNSAIKAQGLSSPVGRRLKLKRRALEGAGLGISMLKAADAILGGSEAISELIHKYFSDLEDSLSLTSALLYLPLIGEEIKFDSLCKITGKAYANNKAILSYLLRLEQVIELKNSAFQAINSLLEEALYSKIVFSDGSVFNIDGQMRTVWTSANIPYDFSITSYGTDSYITKILRKDEPLVLFTAPGYDVLPAHWLDFLIKCNSPDQKITSLSIMAANSKELNNITISAANSCTIIFGLWPWQYINHRHIDSLASSAPFVSQYSNMGFYLSDAVVTLSQHIVNKTVTLRGIIVKKAQEAKPDLFILTNIPMEKASTEQIAGLYLNRWPGLQEGSKDFSGKIESFMYNASSRQPFPKEKIFKSNDINKLGDIFSCYLETLDAYVRWYFLPAEYRKLDLATTKNRFYSLSARIKKRKLSDSVNFILPGNYLYAKDLEYALARMNEREIIQSGGKRIWFGLK